MEKYGVQKEILYTDLRDEEARIMQVIQNNLFDAEKTASSRSELETRLHQVRSKLTELDSNS